MRKLHVLLFRMFVKFKLRSIHHVLHFSFSLVFQLMAASFGSLIGTLHAFKTHHKTNCVSQLIMQALIFVSVATVIQLQQSCGYSVTHRLVILASESTDS